MDKKKKKNSNLTTIEKSDKTSERKKRSVTVTAIYSLVILLMITGTSFALWNYGFIGNTNKIENYSVDLEFLESSNEIISMDNVIPVSDETGKNQADSFKFQVKTKTKSDLNITYRLYVDKLEPSEDYTFLNDKQVKLYLTDFEDNPLMEPTLVSSLDNYLIYTKTNAHSEKNEEFTDKYKLRMWIDNAVTGEGWTNDSKIEYKFKIRVRTDVRTETVLSYLDVEVKDEYKEMNINTQLVPDMFNVTGVYSDGSRRTLSSDEYSIGRNEKVKYVMNIPYYPTYAGSSTVNLGEQTIEDASSIKVVLNGKLGYAYDERYLSDSIQIYDKEGNLVKNFGSDTSKRTVLENEEVIIPGTYVKINLEINPYNGTSSDSSISIYSIPLDENGKEKYGMNWNDPTTPDSAGDFKVLFKANQDAFEENVSGIEEYVTLNIPMISFRVYTFNTATQTTPTNYVSYTTPKGTTLCDFFTNDDDSNTQCSSDLIVYITAVSAPNLTTDINGQNNASASSIISNNDNYYAVYDYDNEGFQ